MSAPLFPLGQVVATPGALRALQFLELTWLLQRHARGDWGCMDAEDCEANDVGIEVGDRLHSAYAIDPGKPCEGYGDNCVWIITEGDRSVTTILLPDEY